jgi:hypothetical protein
MPKSLLLYSRGDSPARFACVPDANLAVEKLVFYAQLLIHSFKSLAISFQLYYFSSVVRFFHQICVI